MSSPPQPCPLHPSFAAQSAAYFAAQLAVCFAAQPAGSFAAQLVASRHSQIVREHDPFGFFQAAVHSSPRWPVDLKHWFLRDSQIRGRRDLFGPFPHRADSWLLVLSSHRADSSRRAHSPRRVASSFRFLSLVPPEPSARSRGVVLQLRALFLVRAFPLIVVAVRPVAEPMRLQPVPVNSLLIN